MIDLRSADNTFHIEYPTGIKQQTEQKGIPRAKPFQALALTPNND